MKVFFIKYKTLYIILVVLLIIILGLIIINMKKIKSSETFNIKDDIYYRGDIDTKTIAFTCNVDWGEEYIPNMLEVLKDENIKITFFVTGTWANKNPDILLKIYNDGHEIGNHGYFHKNYGSLSYELNKDQILKADRIITGIIGKKIKYFAPPSGDYSENTIKAAKDLDYKLIMWSIDTIDWRKDSTKDKIINRVVTKLDNSKIVLMHPKEETIKALPNIIELTRQKGYEIGKLSDIIKQ